MQCIMFSINTQGKIIEMKDLHSYKSALRISIIYLIVGILWIYFSDNLVEFLSSGNIHELTLFQNYKGWFFIIVTAILLLLLNYHYFHKHHIEYMQHINEQKMAHLQLTQKDALLQTIINSSPDAIFVKDLEGKYILFNIGAGILTGVTPEEVIGNGDSVIFSPEIADQLRIMDRSIALNGKIVNHDEYLITASGMEKYFWITKGPVFTKEGDLFGIFGISRDITERKKIEIALQESESFLNQSQRNAGIGSYSLDMKTMLWKSSDTLDEIFGIDHHYEHSLNGWLNLIHPDDRESMSIYFQEYVVDNHQRFDREYRIVRQNDHAIRWVNGLGKLEFDEMNTPVKMVGTIQDVTETKEHEDQLKYMAHYDPLTGLPNRVLKSDRLRHAMTLSQHRGHIAVLYLDLDGFKEVN
ncbi:MAG: PAS domain S-box protein, partial [Sulfuricurvum sp.]|nr:PAS domain S-box protein [Sulfuricurvum sp.]